ncbi:MAG TPA: xanthine dehydrogenase family protein molybdopterin-binding subunit [Herpetosiphonaceae bacterium]|nr:xanthine dehydrogenase family protein molybdopterin-binding subunit [Herpetosiphonaceae bacterium]
MPKLIKSEINVEGRVSVQYALVEGPEMEPWGANEELAIVGRPTPRIDGPARASGEARYTYDVQLAGMLWAAVLRSPHAHARVASIDTAAASALPGVIEIMTPASAPEADGQPLLTAEPRFRGAPIAVVAAVDPAVAADALRLIAVEYEPLPFVSDPEAALQAGAPEVQPGGNIVGGEAGRDERGDVAAGFAAAAASVELTVRTPTAVHNAMETHGCVAAWEGDQLTVYESTQHVYGVRAFAAGGMKLPLNKVRAVGTYMGGGFGAKFPGRAYTLIAAELARRARRPVHLMYDREGENLETGYRGASVQHIRMAASEAGRLSAIDLEIVAEVGAAADWVPGVAGPYQMMYACPNLRAAQAGAYTNLGPYAAFRAPGFVEGTVGLELAMDALARELGLDPLELRRRNIPDLDQTNGKPFSSFPIAECYRRAADAIGWAGRPAQPGAPPQTGRYRRGMGMASQIWWGGGGPPAYAEMRLESDGTATLLTGIQDLGTGSRTIMAQVAAEEFGLPVRQVSVTIGDSMAGPFGPGSGGSVTTGSMTPAVRQAAKALRLEVGSIVAQMEGIPEGEIEIRDGIIYRVDSEICSLAELAGRLGEVMLIGKGSRGPNDDSVSVITSGAQFAEVEVDTVTGRVRVLRIVAAHDCGRIVNPQTFTSQIEGGIIQGLGLALTEERVIDHRAGAVMNPNLEWYKVPTVADIPEITTLLVDIPDVRANATGVKGAGEPGIIPTAAAIANAVAAALGEPITELPITPARVLAALDRRSQRDAAKE